MIIELKEVLATPIDGAGLQLFQLLFGFFMAIEALRRRPFLIRHFTHAGCTFPFLLFRRLPIPSKLAIQFISIVEAVAFLFFALGLLTPLSLSIAFCLYGYFFVLDKSLFNNHFYLILLLLGLFGVILVTPEVRLWHLLLFQGQLLIVYTYGAIAKMNKRWVVDAEPVGSELASFPNKPAFFKARWFAYLIAWGGIAFDLVIIPLLWIDVTRPFAIPFFVAFHLFNAWTLQIGAFPWFSIASVVLFLSPETIRGILP